METKKKEQQQQHQRQKAQTKPKQHGVLKNIHALTECRFTHAKRVCDMVKTQSNKNTKKRFQARYNTLSRQSQNDSGLSNEKKLLKSFSMLTDYGK